MGSLNDIFTPSFFMTLGITVLLITACIVYFENKLREQNHKVASMLSLVSSLAEELNFTKKDVVEKLSQLKPILKQGLNLLNLI